MENARVGVMSDGVIIVSGHVIMSGYVTSAVVCLWFKKGRQKAGNIDSMNEAWCFRSTRKQPSPVRLLDWPISFL